MLNFGAINRHIDYFMEGKKIDYDFDKHRICTINCGSYPRCWALRLVSQYRVN